MVVVLFDLEGTLVQSVEADPKAVLEFRVKTKEKLLALGIPASELEEMTKSTPMRNKALEYVREYFNERMAGRFHLEMDRFLKKFELAWADQSRIHSDTISSLLRLRELGCRMAVVTGTSREAADRILSAHGLVNFFEAVITSEDVSKLKPDPEGVLLALKGLNAKEFFFVGDLVYDAQAAATAGGKSIIVNRDSSKKIEFHTDHVVGSLAEIPNLIQRV